MSVLPFYRRYKPIRASLYFARARLRAPNGAARRSCANRAADYLKLQRRPDLLPLHLALNGDIEETGKTWSSYDYGEGYFYQSFSEIGVSGLRDTEARIAAFDLPRRLAGNTVLDIGCNSGFLDLAVAAYAAHVTGLDPNPHLVRMARRVADHLKRANCAFLACAFEDAVLEPPYDVVMSFANHSTFDGLTRHTLDEYFARCADMLADGGTFLFESHAPAYEGGRITEVIALISKWFDIEQRAVLHYGTYLDEGRTFLVARRRRTGSAVASLRQPEI